MTNNFNLYKDPLTDMNNLFALLECNLESTFGDTGTVLYIDLKNLSGVNKNFGRDMGDTYIKNLAEIIKAEITFQDINSEDVSIYRSGGDEFLIRFSSNADTKVDSIAERINCELNNKMALLGLEGAGIRYTKWSYTEKISSVSYLLRQCNMALFESIGIEQKSHELPHWADNMIENMFCRVKETLQLLQDTNSLALKDEVSQLPNYRAADYSLKNAFSEYISKQSPFSILFIDGDNLKKYNDLGYQHGNKMIKNLGEVISSALRHDDGVYRWLSGDEFLVLLKETSKKKAYALAERIRKQVEEKMKGLKYPVTISIGVSNCPADGADLDTILSVAETANAKAKKAGKNCVV